MKFIKYVKPKPRSRIHDPFSIQTGKYKDGKIDTSYKEGWAEGTFISDNNEKETIGRNFDFKRIPFLLVVLFLFLSLLIGRTAWLQITKGEYYRSVAEGNRIRIKRIEPKRGVIYDRHKIPLVQNKANFMLYFIPADLPDDEEENKNIIENVSTILGTLSVDEINEILSTVDLRTLEAYQPLFIEDNIEYEKAMNLYLKSSFWPGVILSNKTNREYLFVDNNVETNITASTSMSLSHVMGYTGKINDKELEKFGEEYQPIDYIGKMGIEYFWETELKGESGKKQVEVDALGKEKKILGQLDAHDGNNLVLSLDTEMQIKLEEIMVKHLDNNNLTRGSAVVLDPNNGEVLAIVSLPAYSNNVFARGITQSEYNELLNHPDNPLFNRSVSGEFPSGSTVKPVIAAAALQERIVSEHTSFLSTGGLQIGQWYFPDWRTGGHGRVNVRSAIANSVNTYFYIIGGGYQDQPGLGVDRIVYYGELFGLGTQTGIDLAGEASGLLPTPEWKREVKDEQWYIGDTYHLAIGQGDLLVTPLQVALYTSIFANGGKLYRPHFVKEILSSDDELIREIDTTPVRKDFIDNYNMMVVREGMRQTITDGSGIRLQSIPVPVAGKTGTAQWSSKKETHAWFIGFAPYENAELAFAILLEEGGEGSSTAIPVAEELLKWYFQDKVE